MPSTIDATLQQISRMAEEKATEDLANRLDLGYALLDKYPFTLEALSLLPVNVVQNRGIATYLHTAERIRVAILNPQDEVLRAELKAYEQQWKTPVELIVVSPSSMRSLITSYLQLLKEHEEMEAHKQLELSQHHSEEDYFKKIASLQDLQKEVVGATTTKILDIVMAAAVNQEASDIHIEPGGQNLSVRFRIDGVLQKVLDLPMTLHHQLISRIKILTNLKLDDTTSTQDGRFSLADKGIQADIRVNTIPTGYGEGVVMRILRHDLHILDLTELGFSEYNRGLIETAIRRPYGLILVTGPTGSGKSTTLYALLKILNTSERKIITLEDPIEYRLDGLQQSQIDSSKGFTFAEGLKGALRQDPDVVMVGEIRDAETATIALNASLTGHLVLSTLHTNNAVTAHTRLLEMGIQPFLLAGSIQLVVAQRLVRKLVPGSAPDAPNYRGRVVIGEVLHPSQEFEQAVLRHDDQLTLEKIAEAGGMVPMVKDGLDKVKRGITTESEIYRVTTA